jgi:hypothetical protein
MVASRAEERAAKKAALLAVVKVAWMADSKGTKMVVLWAVKYVCGGRGKSERGKEF